MASLFDADTNCRRRGFMHHLRAYASFRLYLFQYALTAAHMQSQGDAAIIDLAATNEAAARRRRRLSHQSSAAWLDW